MSNHAVQRPRLGRVAVLASALLALAPLVRGAQQAPECLIEIHDQSGNVTDGSTLCSVAGSTKSCTFNLALCHNVSGCAVGALKKKLHATGHCNPGHLKISPTDSSCSGAFTGIKVRTKGNGKKPGSCKIRVQAHAGHGQNDLDKVTLACTPSGSSCGGASPSGAFLDRPDAP